MLAVLSDSDIAQHFEKNGLSGIVLEPMKALRLFQKIFADQRLSKRLKTMPLRSISISFLAFARDLFWRKLKTNILKLLKHCIPIFVLPPALKIMNIVPV